MCGKSEICLWFLLNQSNDWKSFGMLTLRLKCGLIDLSNKGRQCHEN